MQYLDKDKDQGRQINKKLSLPLFLRVSMVVLLLFGLTIGAAASLFSGKLKRVFFEEKLRSGEHILDFLASSLKVPLLADDTLRLSSLIRDAADMDGVVYASVVDRDQVVLVHSGQDDMESMNLLKGRDNENSAGLPVSGSPEKQVYGISRVILYNDKPLGTVHLGLSVKYIENSFLAAQLSLIKSFLLPALLLGLALSILVYLYFLRSKKKIDRIIHAVREYGNGKLQYRIEKPDKGEFGDMTLALHDMAQKLSSLGPNLEELEEYLKFSSLDRILESPISKGEAYASRRQVAVLFAGVHGFGSYAGEENPDEVVKALNKYISIVTAVISKQGGYVDKVIGDAVVGIFGVSLYRENHTARAVRAALDLQDALSAGTADESRLLSSVCVGISSGIVLSGNIGSHSKVEYSSIGESIKEAYWLTSLGHPGEIILGEEIYSQMKDSVAVEPLPPQQVLGGSDVIKSFRLLNLTQKDNGHS
ncbi:MAG: adenylate/guanylate cyclase domain-containing protein [Desulfobulbaceae bacterium]|nr:adenylate/guanylate cyclase domain-containing protein [Desulfobulbaceae bacterium]